MLKRIHDKLGTAGLAVAVVALVVALTGTAFAAAGLNGTQKKEVKKIAKQYAGKQGPQGLKGDNGSAGAQGAKGHQGAKGDEGKQGPEGEEGPPGPAETTLPPGKTETGVMSLVGKGQSQYFVNISFPLEVGSGFSLESANNDPVHCAGTHDNPEPAAGFVCLYFEEKNNANRTDEYKPRPTAGVILKFEPEEPANEASMRGTWAARERCPIDPESGEEFPNC